MVSSVNFGHRTGSLTQSQRKPLSYTILLEGMLGEKVKPCMHIYPKSEAMHFHLKQQLSWRWRQTAKNPPCFGFTCLTGGTDRRYL